MRRNVMNGASRDNSVEFIESTLIDLSSLSDKE